MRPVIIQVPEGSGNQALQIVIKNNAKNISKTNASGADKSLEVITSFVPNSNIEDLIDELGRIDNIGITIFPQGVLPLYPPESEAPDQIIDVGFRSPIEIFLGGLQSIGSWKGFLSYAAITGFIIWIALYTNTSYLLVAAMLIAPFAGPAMNAAIATARGDAVLLKSSLARYFSSIFITMLVAYLVSLALDLNITTELMIQRSKISSVALMLPLAAGIAGAINMIQSERASLVSGAATGMLIAASLAPPAGIAGMAAAIGRWDISISGIFLILLQLTIINFSGAIVFRMGGLKTQGPRYNRGKKSVVIISAFVSVAIATALLIWQFSTPVEFQRSAISKEAAEQVKNIIDSNDRLTYVDMESKFTRSEKNEEVLLIRLFVSVKETLFNQDEVKSDLKEEIRNSIISSYPVKPLIDIIILEE